MSWGETLRPWPTWSQCPACVHWVYMPFGWAFPRPIRSCHYDNALTRSITCESSPPPFLSHSPLEAQMLGRKGLGSLTKGKNQESERELMQTEKRNHWGTYEKIENRKVEVVPKIKPGFRPSRPAASRIFERVRNKEPRLGGSFCYFLVSWLWRPGCQLAPSQTHLLDCLSLSFLTEGASLGSGVWCVTR